MTQAMYMRSNWNSTSIAKNFGGTVHVFSSEAAVEVLDYVRDDGLSAVNPYLLQDTSVDLEAIPAFRGEVRSRMLQLDEGCRFTIFAPVEGATREDTRAIYWALSRALGDQVVQHSNGDRISFIFDRDKNKMAEGGRYHEGNEGGYPHTDNVNYQRHYDYLALLSEKNALIGGGNGIVSGQTIYEVLKKAGQGFVETLQGNFWWEARGVNKENITFQSPILRLEDGVPKWRFLEAYLHSAHEREGEKLTTAQENAIEALNAALYDPTNCFTPHLAEGQTLVFNDNEFLHRRVGVFIDKTPPQPEYDFERGENRLRLRNLIVARRGE